MIRIDPELTPGDLLPAIRRMWAASGERILALERRWRPEQGAPVCTRAGRYASRGWTEWTQGFQFGSALLQFDATNDPVFLEIARTGARRRMDDHLTHMGVHDHGFNNVSVYGGLLRLMDEGRTDEAPGERAWLETALRCSGAVQARRWTPIPGGGFIHSFNGPHSLFADTIRSLRSLALAHRLGQSLMEEQDRRISLLDRLLAHARATAGFTVFYGEGRDVYDTAPGRVAHECLFNPVNGAYRCPSTQQGYSPFSTWTRALAWVLLGFAEELEFVDTLGDQELEAAGGRDEIETVMLRAARACSDRMIEESCADGVPFWDTGAPGLARMPGCLERPADPFNPYEPVDSSAAAIAAQGLLRLGLRLHRRGRDPAGGARLRQAGLTMARTLLAEPYSVEEPGHEGLLLHSIYHRPNGWDHTPPGRAQPCGEASMWGDYHLRELAIMIGRLAAGDLEHAFFGPHPTLEGNPWQ